ncbi:MAG: hypothetical protein ACI82G_003118, partial [Bradymonadia bacterium]
ERRVNAQQYYGGHRASPRPRFFPTVTGTRTQLLGDVRFEGIGARVASRSAGHLLGPPRLCRGGDAMKFASLGRSVARRLRDCPQHVRTSSRASSPRAQHAATPARPPRAQLPAQPKRPRRRSPCARRATRSHASTTATSATPSPAKASPTPVAMRPARIAAIHASPPATYHHSAPPSCRRGR